MTQRFEVFVSHRTYGRPPPLCSEWFVMCSNWYTQKDIEALQLQGPSRLFSYEMLAHSIQEDSVHSCVTKMIICCTVWCTIVFNLYGAPFLD